METWFGFLWPYEQCHEYMQKKRKKYLFYQCLSPCSKIVLRDINFLMEKETWRHISPGKEAYKVGQRFYVLIIEIYFRSQEQTQTLKGNFIISLDHLLLGDVKYVRTVNLIVMCLLLHPHWHKMDPLIWDNIMQYTALIKQAFRWWCLWRHCTQRK